MKCIFTPKRNTRGLKILYNQEELYYKREVRKTISKIKPIFNMFIK